MKAESEQNTAITLVNNTKKEAHNSKLGHSEAISEEKIEALMYKDS